jgi:spermidine synthase
VNSFGAVIGTGLAGFFLIRKYGVESTVWIAALFNIAIGLAALVLSKSIKKKLQPNASAAVNKDLPQQIYSETAIRIAVFTALASGFIAMMYELAWIRLLSNILGSTTYSFVRLVLLVR